MQSYKCDLTKLLNIMNNTVKKFIFYNLITVLLFNIIKYFVVTLHLNELQNDQ